MSLPFPIGADEPSDPSRYLRHETTDLADPAFHFSIALPAQMRRVRRETASPSSEQAISTIGIWRDPDNALPPFEVEVYGAIVDREMSGADYLEVFFQNNGIEVLERRIIGPAKAGDRLDALTRRRVGELELISRWFVLKDGGDQRGIMVFAEVRTTPDRYPHLASDMYRSIAHLRLLNPSGWPYAERLRAVAAARPGDFLSYHPISWNPGVMRADDTLEGEHCLVIDNVIEDEVFGQIEIRTLGDVGSADEVLARYLTPMAERGILPEMSPLAPVEPFAGLEEVWATFGHATVQPPGEALDPEPKFDIRATIGRRERCFYLIALFGPARAKLLAHAAVNQRAYEIVLDHLKTEPAAPPESTADTTPPPS